MSDRPPDVPDVPDEERFRPQHSPDERQGRGPVSAGERVADALADVEEIVAVVHTIVARGEDEFFDQEDPRSRLAAKALLIDLAGACEQLDEFKRRDPELWSSIKRTRDKMAHHYRDTNFVRVWETISLHVPRVLQRIREAHS